MLNASDLVEYERIGDYKNGYAIVSKKDFTRYGLIDENFNEIFPCEYNRIHIEENVILLDSKLGLKIFHLYSGRTQNIVNRCLGSGMYNGMISVKNIENKKYGLVDISGSQIIPCKYLDIGYLNHGVIPVENRTILTLGSNQRGVINIDNKVICKYKYDWIDGFEESVAVVKKYTHAYEPYEEMYGLIDVNGREIIKPCYNIQYITSFGGGLAFLVTRKLEVYIINNLGHKLYQIDSESDVSCVSQYQYSEGLIGIKQKKNRNLKEPKWGFINALGEKVVDFVYDKVGRFQDGQAVVKKDNRWGVIDKSGLQIISLVYDAIEKIGLNYFFNYEGYWGLMSIDGNVTIAPKYDRIRKYVNGKWLCELDGKFSIL